MSEHVLEIRNLSIALEGNDAARVVKNLSLSIRPGETMCLVGESGSGKSLTSLATMGLLPKALRPTTGEILVNGVDVLKQSPGKLRDMRATQMAMIFQEPMTALNPVMKVGDQIAEVMEAHGQSRGDRIIRRIDQERQIGKQPGATDPVKLADFIVAQSTRDRLIGTARIDKAITHNPGSRLERRPDPARDVIGAGGSEQQRFGLGRPPLPRR